MGDMADWIIENGEINGLLGDSLYNNGGTKTCKYCNASGLHWEIEDGSGKWRLFDPESRLHICKKHDKVRMS